MMSKWWARAEAWRQQDAEREGVPFEGRDYDEMLDQAAMIYARWRQGAEAETLPHYEGPFQISYNNALMFMPDVLDMVCEVEVGDTSGRRVVPLTDGPLEPGEFMRANGFRRFDELEPGEQQILRDRFPGRFA